MPTDQRIEDEIDNPGKLAFDRQVQEILVKAYERAPQLKDLLSVTVKEVEDCQPLTFAVGIQCNEKPTLRSYTLSVSSYTLNVSRQMKVVSPYDPRNAAEILKRIEDVLLKFSLANLYTIFLGQIWVTRMVPPDKLQCTLNELQEQGYTIHTIGTDPALIVVVVVNRSGLV